MEVFEMRPTRIGQMNMSVNERKKGKKGKSK